MSPHIPFQLDEATNRGARERLRAAGMEFVEEERLEYRVAERGPSFQPVFLSPFRVQTKNAAAKIGWPWISRFLSVHWPHEDDNKDTTRPADQRPGRDQGHSARFADSGDREVGLC